VAKETQGRRTGATPVRDVRQRAGGFVFNGQRVVISHRAQDDIRVRIHDSHGDINACIHGSGKGRLSGDYDSNQIYGCQVSDLRTIPDGYQQTETLLRPWQRVAADIIIYLPRPGRNLKDIVFAPRPQRAWHGEPEELCSDRVS